MEKGETIVRYFLKGSAPMEEKLIGQISYRYNETPIIPVKDAELYLDEIMREDYQEDYDFHVVDSIQYTMGCNKSNLIDVIVTGGYFNIDYYEDNYDDDDELEGFEFETKHRRIDNDYLDDEDERYYNGQRRRRMYSNEEGYFDY